MARESTHTGTRILPRSTELDRLAEEMLDKVKGAVDCERISFSRLCGSEEIEIMAVRSDSGGPQPGARFPLRDVLGSQAVLAGLVVEVDLSNFAEELDRMLFEQGFRHALRVPIGQPDAQVAALALVRRAEQPFTRAEIDAVTELAREAGARVMALSEPADEPDS